MFLKVETLTFGKYLKFLMDLMFATLNMALKPYPKLCNSRNLLIKLSLDCKVKMGKEEPTATS